MNKSKLSVIWVLALATVQTFALGKSSSEQRAQTTVQKSLSTCAGKTGGTLAGAAPATAQRRVAKILGASSESKSTSGLKSKPVR